MKGGTFKLTNVSPVFVLLLGMGTVFFGLLCLIVLTKLMSKVLGEGKDAAAKAAPAPVAAPVQAATPDVADRKAFDAAIAAAIATYMGGEPQGLRIRSIKKI
ncbi:MAG: OadG family protein [Clostridia bacterium]|nr:OadG family protein [Clostridia bacterium]